MDIFSGKQILIPIVALVLLAVFNLIADPSFYKITLDVNSAGNHVLSGYLITILDYGSELAILAIGMTLVTAASGGQDISVGAGIAIAGSVIGETAEETVHREVMEEVGLKVKNIRYYKSQPWGFDSNLLMGFFCDLAEEGEIRLEEEELSLAEWVDYRDVPDDPEGLSLTREMMTYFRKQREQGLNP